MTYLRTHISSNCKPIIGHAYKNNFPSTSFPLIVSDRWGEILIGTEWWMNNNEMWMKQDPGKHTKMPDPKTPKFCNWFILKVLASFYPKFRARLGRQT